MHPKICLDLSDTDYHADPAIGSTTAVVGLENEPLLLDMLNGLHEVEDKPCFVSGRLLHMAVLEPSKFEQLTVSEGPINERTGQPYGRSTKAFAEWQAENPHLTMIDPWIMCSIERMPKAVKNIFNTGGTSEASVFVEHNGARFKCRPDWWDYPNKRFYDLKSIATGGGSMERAVEKAIRNRSYWFTTAWYRRVIELITGENHHCELIFAEKEPPYRWRIVDLDYDYLKLGDTKVNDIMYRICNDLLGEDADDIYHQAAAPLYLLDDEEGEE